MDIGFAQGQGSRDSQQDQYKVIENVPTGEDASISLFLVADGHGSNEYSRHCSQMIPKLIFQSEEFLSGRYDAAIVNSFFEEDKALRREVYQRMNEKRGGSTLTVALYAEGSLFLANVGDSRAVLAERVNTKGDYNAIRVSREHKILVDEGERKRLRNLHAKIRGDRLVSRSHSLNMTRALGDFDFKKPQVDSESDWVSPVPHLTKIDIQPSHEFLILASDGLWDFVNDEDMVRIIVECRHRKMSAQDIATELVKEIEGEPHSDNVTIIIVFFEGEDVEE